MGEKFLYSSRNIFLCTADFKNLELNTNINKNCYENFAH